MGYDRISMKSVRTRVEQVTLRLRQMVVAGEFPPGTHLAEVPLAERLGVSRTPVRLALAVLEREGLLQGSPHRGFVVREITVAEIADGFEVRAALEALACRQAIERGVDASTRDTLRSCIEEGDRLLSKGFFTEADPAAWGAMNGRFHEALIGASRNVPLAAAYAFNAARPLVGPNAIAFNVINLEVSYRNMKAAHAGHVAIVKAMLAGDIARTDAMVRKHAAEGRDDLTRVLATVRAAQAMPGLKLVVG